MISLDQIRNLENKVHAAVSRIKTLSSENATLKQRLESYEERVAELETLVSAFKADQEQIEAGIVAALSHLDELEDAVSEPERTTEAAPDTPPPDDVAPEPATEAAEDESAGADDQEAAPAENEPGGAEPAGAEPAGSEPAEEEDEPELDIF